MQNAKSQKSAGHVKPPKKAPKPEEQNRIAVLSLDAKDEAVTLDMRNRDFIVTSLYGFGRGPSIAVAKARCKKEVGRAAKTFFAYLAHETTTMDDSGRINYHGDERAPVKLGYV